MRNIGDRPSPPKTRRDANLIKSVHRSIVWLSTSFALQHWRGCTLLCRCRCGLPVLSRHSGVTLFPAFCSETPDFSVEHLQMLCAAHAPTYRQCIPMKKAQRTAHKYPQLILLITRSTSKSVGVGFGTRLISAKDCLEAGSHSWPQAGTKFTHLTTEV